MPWVNGKLLNMEEKDLYIFDHIYTKLVEAKVINAIKHVQNGSLGFQKYYLGSFEKAGHDKREILREILEENPELMDSLSNSPISDDLKEDFPEIHKKLRAPKGETTENFKEVEFEKPKKLPTLKKLL